jgi:hypothetical protein
MPIGKFCNSLIRFYLRVKLPNAIQSEIRRDHSPTAKKQIKFEKSKRQGQKKRAKAPRYSLRERDRGAFGDIL